MKSKLAVSIIILIFLLTNPGVQAKEYSVPEGLDDTRVVEYESWDSYKILANNRDVDIEVELSSGHVLDFYILTKSQFNDYQNPEIEGFEYEDIKEKVPSFSWSGSRGTYFLVIDNAEITVSGAVPTDNETYTIDITYSEINQLDTFIGFLGSLYDICFVTLCSSFSVCGITILIAIITTIWMYRVPKEYRQKARQLKGLNK